MNTFLFHLMNPECVPRSSLSTKNGLATLLRIASWAGRRLTDGRQKIYRTVAPCPQCYPTMAIQLLKHPVQGANNCELRLVGPSRMGLYSLHNRKHIEAQPVLLSPACLRSANDLDPQLVHFNSGCLHPSVDRIKDEGHLRQSKMA